MIMVMEELPRETIAPHFSVRAPDSAHADGKPRWLPLLLGAGLLLGVRSWRTMPLALTGAMLLYRGATGRWAFADLLGFDHSGAHPHPATSVPHQTGIKEERSILINKTPEEIYRYWRNLENLPHFMSGHLAVEQLDDKRSHWKIQSLAGATFQWDAEVINDIPGALLAWRSLDGDLDHAGSVHFDKAARGGTKVTVIMEYRPPAGRVGAAIAALFGQKPGQVIEKNLQRLKQLMESGAGRLGSPRAGKAFQVEITCFRGPCLR